ncbi:GTP-binding protein [Aquabacterium lacunae]|uniref:GTP-binding protein n=1 Tax=Aquabacterium lacunae TaxID=2528630 RepID=A0A4Q9H4F9_9BURK|nr:AAA family ATPase [Aquabacterium lacunae]TBO30401.1 GTP-binding protein [Aquabacterium lacunae]
MSFHLTRLKVEQLRRFRQPFELRDLQPGLNLICGPNEAGKSTLVRAIRAAFFERYRSTAVDDLRPWGDSGATPQVVLGFEHDGVAGELSKSFLGSKRRCDLRIGAQSWQGAEAEDHLAQWLGFGFAAKGASKAEHWGIPGLLWVSQGTGQDLQAAADHAHAHLHQALARHGQGGADAPGLTGLAATEGDAVLAQVDALREVLLTATGRPKGALAEALAQLDATKARVQDLQAQVSQYQQEVDALSQLRAEHQRDEAERPWEALEQQLTQAREALNLAEQARQQLDEAQAREAELQRQQQWAQQVLSHSARQAQGLVQRAEQARLAAERAQRAEQALLQAQTQRDLAEAAWLKAQAVLQRAQQAEQCRQWQRDLQALRRDQAQAAQSVQQAEAAERALLAVAQPQGTTALSLKESDIRRLRTLQADVAQARLRLEGLATRLRFDLLPGQHLQAQGLTDAETLSLQGQGEQLLLGATRLTLPGLGALQIEPGGADPQALTRQHHTAQAAEAAWLAALNELGVPDLESAEARLAEQVRRQQQQALAEQALQLVAPHGLPALRAHAARLAQDVDTLQQALARAGDTAASDPAADSALAEPGAGLAATVAEAEAACKLAEQALQRATAAHAQAQSEQAAARALADSTQREWALAEQQAQQPDQLREQAEAQARLTELHTLLQTQQARVQQCQQQISQARPDILAQDVSRLGRSLAQVRQTHQQRSTQLALSEQALAQQGAQGLEERLALAQAEAARAARRLAELQQRAEALTLLRDRLQVHRQAALTRLQAPLQHHLQRYLGLLFPGAELTLSPTLVPTVLQRPQAGGLAERGVLDELSFGAREQLGLISRLAYADLLREAGRPTLIMLDDALVHTDAQRLTQMKRVLFDAATRHQVLLFSCHPEWWRDLGMAPRVLPAG